MDQAASLRSIFLQRKCIQRVRSYHAKIRKAVSTGDLRDVSSLLKQLEVAQRQLEAAFERQNKLAS
ncbi:hypothetical protein L4D09_27480 [Photobacterium makurazakiensis]|uniref:hypothetical protein n=1 Tax=Photobacterium makurazakiensis TaxID=2910234 RepID=UPI003D13A234